MKRRLLHRKNQAHKVLGHCLTEQGQLSQCIIVSRQFNYNIDSVLLQLIFLERNDAQCMYLKHGLQEMVSEYMPKTMAKKLSVFG